MKSKTHSFNPFKYLPNSTIINKTGNKSSGLKEEELIIKGHKRIFQVNLGKFSKLCKKFRSMKDTPIKQLKGNNREDFNLMVSYVHLLYGTNYYKRLFRKVKKYFGDMEYIKPGTVGSYFGGCLSDSTFKEDKPGCSVACAGSIPLPKDEEGWSFCDKAVILAESLGNHHNFRGYNFTVLKEPEEDLDMDPCYVFIDSLDLHNFPGFNSREMDDLDKLGCRKIILVGYDDDGLSYSELYDHPIDIYEIKFRTEYKKEQNTSTAIALAFTLFVLFILLLIAYGYKYGFKDLIDF